MWSCSSRGESFDKVVTSRLKKLHTSQTLFTSPSHAERVREMIYVHVSHLLILTDGDWILPSCEVPPHTGSETRGKAERSHLDSLPVSLIQQRRPSLLGLMDRICLYVRPVSLSVCVSRMAADTAAPLCSDKWLRIESAPRPLGRRTDLTRTVCGSVEREDRRTGPSGCTLVQILSTFSLLAASSPSLCYTDNWFSPVWSQFNYHIKTRPKLIISLTTTASYIL